MVVVNIKKSVTQDDTILIQWQDKIFFKVCNLEIYCKWKIYSVSTVILGRSYLSEIHNWMRMLDSEPQFSMARSAMQNVCWAILCTPSKDTKVSVKAN